MENCKKCPFYDSEYDELLQSGEDVLVIGQEGVEKHYCRMYDHPIDPDITNGKKICKFYINQ